jgi:DNA primase
VARIAQKSVETIKHQVNLVDLVSPYVELKRAGSSWKGLSPFTQEKTPSFYVHPDRGYYKCFSTGEGGDCFSFIMKVENLEFPEAIEYIARKFNITLEYEAGGPSNEERSLRKQIFEIHELATTWFHQQLVESEEAAPVRTYWQEQRGFTMETADEVKIGYAPAARNALALHLKTRDISTAAMHQSGLFFARDNENTHSNFKSRFRGRLMVPIRDVQGRVVAFTARQLEQTPADDPAREAKYVNSPETQIFHKGRILFGMDHARTHLKEGGSFLLVEGQLDAIRCWSVGLHTAVAPQGTAITDDQLHLMRRYQPNFVDCLLDGDKAGRKAALRALPLAFKAGLEFRFLLLPEKADPDDLLRQHGAEALETLRKTSKSAIELAISESLPEDRPPSTNEKTTALRSVFDLLQHVPSEVAREDYIQTASKLLNVDQHAALIDFKKSPKPQAYNKGQENQKTTPKVRKDTLLTDGTWELLWLVLHFPEHSAAISEIIDYDWINNTSPAGRLLKRILAELREGLIEDTSNIENLIETIEDRRLLADLHSRDLDIESDLAEMEINTQLNYIYNNYLKNRLKTIKQRVANAAPEEQEDLMRKVIKARNELAAPHKLEI